MKFHLYSVTGYAEAIMSLRMSRGKNCSIEKAREIQEFVYAVTNKHGSIASPHEYSHKLHELGILHFSNKHPKIAGVYEQDVAEFKRLLEIVLNNSMGHHDHHTMLKYITVSFITEGLHRGAQDDLDAHAMGFNNRITRFSTRLATIEKVEVSEWYEDKIIPFNHAFKLIRQLGEDLQLPLEIEHNGDIFKHTPFGYVLAKYADMPVDSHLRKDVVRGLIHLATPGPAMWMTDLWNLRYIYYRRGKLTKAHPELRDGMEQLADQIAENIPVFGDKFRMEYTDSGKWEHTNLTKTITLDEWKEYQSLKESKS